MKIFLFGYGKMGKEIEKLAIAQGHEIAGIYDPYSAFKFDQRNFDVADVVIDYTTPGSAVYNITKCFEANKPIVVGTTGWYDDLPEVEKTCIKHNGSLLYASNFSIGVNILFRACELVAAIIRNYPEYKATIYEAHHNQKKDSPSGTAITIANLIIGQHSNYLKWKEFPDDSKVNPEPHVLPIYYRREADIVGVHDLVIESPIDRLSVEHEAFSRTGFAAGTLIATQWLLDKKGIFTMKNIFEDIK